MTRHLFRSNIFSWHTPSELLPVWEDSHNGKLMPRDAGSAAQPLDRSSSPFLHSLMPRTPNRDEPTFSFAEPQEPLEGLQSTPLTSPMIASSPLTSEVPPLERDDFEQEFVQSKDSLQEREPFSPEVEESDVEKPSKRRRVRRESSSEIEGVEETVVDEQPPQEQPQTPQRPRRRTSRLPYVDPLDVAEGRTGRYRSLSSGAIDPETMAMAKEIVGDTRLETSKSPILDALVYCALKGWGVRITKNEGDDIRITVDDFQKYYACSAAICSKEHPTEDQSSRIKALRRWFPDFPAKQDEAIMLNLPFEVQVQKPVSKDNKPKKLRDIIRRMSAFIATENRGVKRRREDDY